MAKQNLRQYVDKLKTGQAREYREALDAVYEGSVQYIEGFSRFHEALVRSVADGSLEERAKAFIEAVETRVRKKGKRQARQEKPLLNLGIYTTLKDKGVTEEEMLREYGQANPHSINGYRVQYILRKKREARKK